MPMRLLDLSTTQCLSLCWCTPLTGMSRALGSIRRRWPSAAKNDVAGVAETVSPAEGRQVTMRTGILRDETGKRVIYLLRMHLQTDVPLGQESRPSGMRSLHSDSVLPFLKAVLPESIRKKERPVRFCSEFAYPLDHRGPVFELPVSLMAPADDGTRTQDARLDGLVLSFPKSESGIENLRITVDDKRKRVRLRFEGKGRVLLGDDPVRAVHGEAERVALAFTQEVAPK